jgi:hypothetical protein
MTIVCVCVCVCFWSSGMTGAKLIYACHAAFAGIQEQSAQICKGVVIIA